MLESYFQGGDGSAIYKSGGTDGMEGIVAGDCSLFFHASTVHGGRGGDGYDPSEFFGDGGDGAPAFLLDNCYLEIFGSAEHYIKGGSGGSPGFMGDYGDPANAVLADYSTVLYSGATFYSATAIFAGTASEFSEITPAVPVITTEGSGLLGTFIEPNLHAPPGTQYVLFLSPFAAVNKVGLLHAHFLLRPTALFILKAGVILPGGVEKVYLTVPFLSELQGQPLMFQAWMNVHGGEPTTRISTAVGFIPR
jgi:hypothetical protein